MIEFGDFRYDPESRFLYRGAEEIPLPPRVLAVLESLLKRPGKLIAKDDILASAWDGAFVGEDSLTQAVSQLRNALGDDPRNPAFIQTIPKRGYRFVAEVSGPLPDQGAVPRPTADSEVGEGTRGAVAEKVSAMPSELSKLVPGAKVGHYEILGRIGTGAMGEVWRARDTNLEREVAIKVVSEVLVKDPAVIERFRREALMLATVNHPNIATIHSVEKINETPFIVMELLEGRTLQQRLEEGPLPLDISLHIALQITRALEVAHDAGIVHRDLKPANTMLVAGNHVKVLDFGLAKEITPNDRGVSAGPAVLTASGVLVGTAAYMSPEQAAGRPIDKRSDIFSFGCMLFEMLAGTRPFAGAGTSEILAAILRDEPDWSALPESTPRSAHRLLRRCLKKDPDKRLHDIADARIEIEEAVNESSLPPSSADDPIVQPKTFRQALPWLLAITLLISNAVTLWSSRPPEPPLLPTRFSVAMPDGLRLAPPGTTAVAISPDGRSLVYRAIDEQGQPSWFHQSLDELAPNRIQGFGGGNAAPFFSPRAEWLGFRRGRTLSKVSLSGGEPIPVADVVNALGAWWGPNGEIVYVPEVGAGINMVSDEGGVPETLVSPDLEDGELGYYWPQFLPNGRDVLFTVLVAGNWNRSRIAVYSPETDTKTIVHEGGYFARYVPTGHLVYAHGTTLMAVAFDIGNLAVTGTPVPVVENLNVNDIEGIADFHFSDSGTLAYRSGGPSSTWTLDRVGHDGTGTPLGLEPRRYDAWAFSRDGSQLVVSILEDDFDIWIADLDSDTGLRRRLTINPVWENYPIFTPDDEWVTFSSERPGYFDLWQTRSDGSGEAFPLLSMGNDHAKFPGSWSPDGRFLAFTERHPDTGRDIWIFDAESGEAAPFQATEFDERDSQFSPDGRWIAYVSDRDGLAEVYVAPAPAAGGAPHKVSGAGGGDHPRWSPSGDQLYYISDGMMMVVSLEFETAFTPGRPSVLFEIDAYSPIFEVSPDGEHFLMRKTATEEDDSVRLNVVLNWFEELKRRVPPGR